MKKNLLTLYITLVFSTLCFGQQIKRIEGVVLDEEKQVLQFASVRINNENYTVYTNSKGEFSLPLRQSTDSVDITVSYVGMLSQTRKYKVGTPIKITLRRNTLEIKEVSIRNKRRQSENSNSSIYFDEEAIERVQAFSLMDVLNTLPDRMTVAPNILNPQTITFRSQVSGVNAMANSFGIGIIMDGQAISTDANMQSRSVSRFGLAGGEVSSRFHGSFDTPFQGLDLRQIPVENIEKVEILQGVASAKYGEITDGAIIIERKAGKTPYHVSTSINRGSTNIGANKGFKLNDKLGALNLSINYAHSNSDPRDNMRSYRRISQNLMWTTNLGSKIKNTLSFDYNKRLDDVKEDPDDASQLMTKSHEWGTRVSNRFSFDVQSKWIERINLSGNLSTSSQSSYNQWLLNGMPKEYSNKDSTGTYEGFFIPGNYLAVEHVEGKPVTAGMSLDFITKTKIHSTSLNFSYGFSYNFSQNRGRGIVVDGNTPRWVNRNGQNDRPYDFRLNSPNESFGAYLEMNATSTLWGRKLWNSLGLRQDAQNGYWTLQPRINSRYDISPNWQANIAFGVATKSPSLAHIYPSPTWLDIPLLSYYPSNGMADNALYLVHTQKYIADNSLIKPSRSSQFEVGLRYNNDFISSSLFGYVKRNDDIFNDVTVYRPLTLPKYEYHLVPGQKPTYNVVPNEFVSYITNSERQIQNTASSYNKGLTWTLQTNPIDKIATALSFSSTINYSDNIDGRVEESIVVNEAWRTNPKAPKYVYHNKPRNSNWSAMSKLSGTTSIPKIGFYITTSLDVHLGTYANSYMEYNLNPVGYLSGSSVYYEFPNADPEVMQFYESLVKASKEDYDIGQRRSKKMYTQLNMSIAKEIKKTIRIGIMAYNTFNSTPHFLTTSTTGVAYSRLIEPISITGTISIKL